MYDIQYEGQTSINNITDSANEIYAIGKNDLFSYTSTITIVDAVTNCFLDVLWSNDQLTWVQATQTPITTNNQVIGIYLSDIGYKYVKIQWTLDDGTIEVDNTYCAKVQYD